MNIQFYFDVSCPWCFIGHKHLQNALRPYPKDHRVSVDYHSFLLSPDMPHEVSEEDYYKRVGLDPQAMKAGQAQLSEIGRTVGITFKHGPGRVLANTLNAHRLIRFANPDKRPELVDALFESHFSQGHSYGNLDSLAQAGERAGVGSAATLKSFLEGQDLKADVLEDVKLSNQQPMITVPYILVNQRFPVQFVHMAGVADFALKNLWEG